MSGRSQRRSTDRAPDTGRGQRRGRRSDRQRQADHLTTVFWHGDRTEGGAGAVDFNDGPNDDDLPGGLLATDDRDELYLDAVDPERTLPIRLPRPIITIWVEDGDLEWEVAEPWLEHLSDPLRMRSVVSRMDKLNALAEVIANRQRRALLAGEIGEAYRRLVAIDNAAIAGEVGTETLTGSAVSRENTELVRAPFGLVPLAFFTSWVSSRSPELRLELEELSHILSADPTLTNSGAASLTAERLRRPDRASDLRKHAPVVRAILGHEHVVGRHRRMFPLSRWEHLRDDLPLSRDGASRAMTACVMALVGVIGEEGGRQT